MPILSRSRRAVLAGGLILVLSPPRASAHAILEASEPTAGGTVRAGTIVLKLRFNSRIDRERSRLMLTGPDQSKTVLPITPEGPPDIVSTTVALAPGAYVVRWQVLAVDGHITRGDVPFTVTGF